MSPRRIRMPFIALATILFLAVSVDSDLPPMDLAATAEPPPSPEDVVLLEELTGWLNGELAGEAPEADLADTIRSRQESFDLFRRFNGTETNREVVTRLPYGEAIYRAARRHRVDSLLLAAVVETESSFNPRAVSSQGAVGLAQVMPHTVSASLDLYDPTVNLDVGARYIRHLLDRYEGDLVMALAAYNAGPGKVARYGGVPPYRETRRFIDRVLSRYIGHHQVAWQSSEVLDLLVLR